MNQMTALPNPFRNTVATDPWQPACADVPEIHDRAFTRCRQALDHVRSQGQTASILIMGEPGSGKTHLLARLHSYLAATPAPAGSPVKSGGVFISVLLQTSPHMIWRYLRRRFVDDLLRAADGGSQFEQILLHRLAECHPAAKDAQFLLHRMREEARNHNGLGRELEMLFDHIQQQTQAPFDLNLCTVISHLLLQRHVREARAWLRGDDLSDAALKRLEIGQGDESDQEEKARETVLALSHLAGPQIPLVFCFDQVEALQVNPQDQAGLFAFGQMITSLHNQTSNVLLISCIQTAFLDTLQSVVSGIARDRLESFGRDTLQLLTREEATQLLEARMNSYPDLASLRTAQPHSLWPLREIDLDEALGPVGRCTPRKLLSACAEKFETVRRPGAVTARTSVTEFLGNTWEERSEQALASNPAEQTDQIIGQGFPLLVDLAGKQWQRREQELPPDVDLVFEDARGRLGISLCNHKNMTSLAAKLRRLRERSVERLVLLRSARLPLGRQAARTRQYSDELLAQGVRWVKPTDEALAALDALRSLLSDAKAGDLVNGGETITPTTVQEWLTANLSWELRSLMEEVLQPETRPIDFNLCEDIAEVLQLHHLVSVDDVAVKLSQESAAIESCAQRYPDRFGLLSGPPAVLFQLVSQGIES